MAWHFTSFKSQKWVFANKSKNFAKNLLEIVPTLYNPPKRFVSINVKTLHTCTSFLYELNDVDNILNDLKKNLSIDSNDQTTTPKVSNKLLNNLFHHS